MLPRSCTIALWQAGFFSVLLEPYRYLAIRIRSPQGVLFSDGTGVKLFAVVTNDWEMGGRELLEWQRGKAGSVEHTHRWLKDELAAGVYPSGKFGANAAWLPRPGRGRAAASVDE